MRAFCIFISSLVFVRTYANIPDSLFPPVDQIFRRLAICWLLLTALAIQAQHPVFNFQKLGSEEGLNNANIFNIAQGPDDLMYFTTQNGIYTYDGYNFRLLDIDSLKTNALLYSTVGDNNDLLLSIRGEGIASYVPGSRRFVRRPHLQLNNMADQVLITGSHAYLLSAGIRLLTVDLQTGRQVPDALAAGEKFNRALCMLRTSDGHVLVGRSDGLYEMKGAVAVKLPVAGNRPVHSMTQAANGQLLLGTTDRILVVSAGKVKEEIVPVYKTKSFTFQLGGEKSVDRLLADQYGRIWFTSYPDDRLYLYQDHTTYDVFDILGLQSSLINCMYMDRRQNLWLGTYSEGAYYLQNSFFSALGFTFDKGRLSVGQVHLKGSLLVAGTSNGCYAVNLANGQSRVLSKPDVIPDPVNNIAEYDGVLYYSKNSTFNLSPSIFLDARSAYKFKPVVAREFYPLSERQSILADAQADILLANGDGSKVMDTLISFPDYRIQVNRFLKLGDSLYIATSNGLYVYSFSRRKYHHLVAPELNYNINDLCVILGKLYAAHEGGVTEIKQRRLQRLVGEHPLNSVRRIRWFKNRIWLATLDGLYVCTEAFEPVKRFNKSNGLPSGTVNDIAFNGEQVSIATARGVATAHIDDILGFDPVPRAVTIDHVTSGGATVTPVNANLQLEADQEDLTVYFYSPYFDRPNKQYFRYRLDNSPWKSFSELSISMQLKGGMHKLELSASTDNLSWSTPTVLNISKAEKFTERQETYLLASLAALALLGGISFLRIRFVKAKARRRLEEEKQVNQLKHQAMNSLLSPHFIFNSLTSIQNYINTNNSLKASEYLAKFSRLIRMIIEKASQAEISLYDELARLTYYLELEKERFKNKFDYVIHIDETIDTREVSIPNMIIQPHVENCIIHGILPKQEHGTLHISFKKPDERKFVIVIEDDGVGLIKAAEHAKTGHKSLGTSTIRDILEINSKLTGKRQRVSMVDKSTLDPTAHGTIITIEIEL